MKREKYELPMTDENLVPWRTWTAGSNKIDDNSQSQQLQQRITSATSSASSSSTVIVLKHQDDTNTDDWKIKYRTPVLRRSNTTLGTKNHSTSSLINKFRKLDSSPIKPIKEEILSDDETNALLETSKLQNQSFLLGRSKTSFFHISMIEEIATSAIFFTFFFSLNTFFLNAHNIFTLRFLISKIFSIL